MGGDVCWSITFDRHKGRRRSLGGEAEVVRDGASMVGALVARPGAGSVFRRRQLGQENRRGCDVERRRWLRRGQGGL